MSKRTRIGVLLPSVNQTLEPDFYRVAPQGVTVHAERIWSPTSEQHSTKGARHYEELNSDLDRAARYVSRVLPDLIVYGCTSGSFWNGLEYEQALTKRLEIGAGVPVISTSSAALAAMRHLGLRSLSVGSPYGDWVNNRLREFLEKAGFGVLAIAGEPTIMAKNAVEEIGNQDPADIRRFVRGMAHPDCDGIFLSCTAWRAMEAVEGLELDLGRPVVSANQATIWQAFKQLGVSPPEAGREGTLLRSL